MNSGYNIEIDHSRALLSVTLNGFFAYDQVESLRGDLRVAIRQLQCKPGSHVSLFDIRGCKIQSQEVVSAFRSMSDTDRIVARRLAIVVGDSLMRMQLRRMIGPERDAKTFDDAASARRWLTEGLPKSGSSASQA
jgi:hypothetical protein